MENGIFNRRNVISICVVAAVIVILTIVFLSRSNTGDEHIDDIQRDSVKYEDMQNKRAGTEQVTSQQTAGYHSRIRHIRIIICCSYRTDRL